MGMNKILSLHDSQLQISHRQGSTSREGCVHIQAALTLPRVAFSSTLLPRASLGQRSGLAAGFGPVAMASNQQQSGPELFQASVTGPRAAST